MRQTLRDALRELDDRHITVMVNGAKVSAYAEQLIGEMKYGERREITLRDMFGKEAGSLTLIMGTEKAYGALTWILH